MRNKRVLQSQTQSTAATGRPAAFLVISFQVQHVFADKDQRPIYSINRGVIAKAQQP